MSQYKGFTTVKLKRPQRSRFDLSHEKRLSTRMGKLVPVFFTETLPNDTFRCNTEIMLRFAPLIFPVMHRVNVFVHFFFVPMRLLWRDWELFITNGRLGTETPPVPPNTTIGSIQARAQDYLDVGSQSDYLGLGTIPDSDAAYANITIDHIPNAAMYKVWYDYYRDRNYVADNTILPLASGLTNTAATLDALYSMKNRDWQKDYFTSALPWTQRGSQVLMPMVGSGSVTYLTESLVLNSSGAPPGASSLVGVTGTTSQMRVGKTDAASAGGAGRIENIQSVNVTNSSVTINDLRRAVRLQEWLERNALAGSRYNESIMAHFGRKTSDARLQRAEYLGGGKVAVKISEVLTNAYSEDDSAATVPPASMSGHGLSFGNTNRFTYNCEEHGIILGVMSVMPTSGYMQGSHRAFFGRNTFLDYPWPSFAHLGEQPVYNYEIYQASANTPVTRANQPVFGYQSRYSDWKQIQSSAHGAFKTSLEAWHITRKFASTPALGSTFCNFEDALQDRIFNVTEGSDNLWCYIFNNCSVIRSLPYYGTPEL